MPILLGLFILYAPAYWQLAQGLWQTEEQSHAPLIALIVLYLCWQKRSIFTTSVEQHNYTFGIPLFSLGLLIAICGYALAIPLLLLGSQLLVLSGVLLITYGRNSLSQLRFPLLYLSFMLPIPGIILQHINEPLKELLSRISLELLYHLGYPIARHGVLLNIGQYQMFFADACSGIHSLTALCALGVLYIYTKQRSLTQRLIMLINLLPIALCANLLRVLLLLLVTYHFGDASGRAWHEMMGVLVFISALLLLLTLDYGLLKLVKRSTP